MNHHTRVYISLFRENTKHQAWYSKRRVIK